MSIIDKAVPVHFRLPRLTLALLRRSTRRRRQATMDLLFSSPHLRRDIGLLEEHFSTRGR